MLEAFNCPSRPKETCLLRFVKSAPEIAAYVKDGELSVCEYLNVSEWRQVFDELKHFPAKTVRFTARNLFSVQSLCALSELPAGWKVKTVVHDEIDTAETELTGNTHRNFLTYQGFSALKKLNEKSGIELTEDYTDITFFKA